MPDSFNGNGNKAIGPLSAQSAMEYLMTYGWAILIIAIVLLAMFQLGLFSSLQLAPKIPPGSCQVVRPNGPGNNQFITLEGTCNKYLPQFVAEFNGKDSNITANLSLLKFVNTGTFTVSAWIMSRGYTGSEQNVVSLGNDGCYVSYYNGTNDTGVILLDAPGAPGAISSSTYPTNVFKAAACIYNTTYEGSQWEFVTAPFNSSNYNHWFFLVETYNGNSLQLYINGKLANSTVAPGFMITPKNYISIGSIYTTIDPGVRLWYNGSIANVQIYNSSFSLSQVQQLYKEGIIGAPADLYNLVSWIPLDGNAADYGGNGANGKSLNSTYTNAWVSNYTVP